MGIQQRLRSAWTSAQSDQSSLCTQWVAKDPLGAQVALLVLSAVAHFLLYICSGMELLQEIQTSSTRKSPFAEAALQKLLDSNLSAKYALTGFLSMNCFFFSPLCLTVYCARIDLSLHYLHLIGNCLKEIRRTFPF